jgi:hypothetical protein
MVPTGFIWLRIGTIGGLFWTRYWTFGFYKMFGIYWVAERLVASLKRLGSMDLVNNIRWRVKIMKLFINLFFLFSCCLFLVGLHIILIILFPNTLSLCPSPRVMTADRTIILKGLRYFQILMACEERFWQAKEIRQAVSWSDPRDRLLTSG